MAAYKAYLGEILSGKSYKIHEIKKWIKSLIESKNPSQIFDSMNDFISIAFSDL